MCYGCWADAGWPTGADCLHPGIAWAVDRGRRLRSISASGSVAHIIIEDCNIDESSVDFCLEAFRSLTFCYPSDEELLAGQFASAMRDLSINDRRMVMTIIDGVVDGDGAPTEKGISCAWMALSGYDDELRECKDFCINHGLTSGLGQQEIAERINRLKHILEATLPTPAAPS